jgi:hypothetical protein
MNNHNWQAYLCHLCHLWMIFQVVGLPDPPPLCYNKRRLINGITRAALAPGGAFFGEKLYGNNI